MTPIPPLPHDHPLSSWATAVWLKMELMGAEVKELKDDQKKFWTILSVLVAAVLGVNAVKP